jgi:hypothetical protein
VRAQPSVQTPRSRSTDRAGAEVLATFPWLGGCSGDPACVSERRSHA